VISVLEAGLPPCALHREQNQCGWRHYERSSKTDDGEPHRFDAALRNRLLAKYLDCDRDNDDRFRAGEREVRPGTGYPIIYR
jgi:hypothetical protein